MPRYEYQCSACGVRFECTQHYDDAPVTVCPECGSKVHRLIGPVALIFKGPGFYSTDHPKGKSSD
jgi:putative FmdB family regulatory protein